MRRSRFTIGESWVGAPGGPGSAAPTPPARVMKAPVYILALHRIRDMSRAMLTSLARVAARKRNGDGHLPASAVSANGPQVDIKSCKTFSPLCRKKGIRAYLLMNRHGNGEAAAANVQRAVNLLGAAGLRVDAGSFQPGQGQAKKMARCAARSGKYHMLIMFGGDGTINKGVQAVMQANNVSLGVICGGTVNHVSRVLYGNHDSRRWWVNVLRLMQSTPTSVDVGTIEVHLVGLVGGETKRVPKALRKTVYFLLSASLGAEATIVAIAPQQLKYMADRLMPGGGSLMLLETGLTHLQNLRPFPARISNGNPADGWSGNARAVIVANANYPWCPAVRIDDGKLAATAVTGLVELAKRESDQAVLSGEDLFATVPYGSYLEVDGSLTDLAGGIAKELGPIESVTYRYGTKKISMLLPYTVAQPLLTNPMAAPPPPADVAPLASETFFDGAQPISVTVEGTAWLGGSRWVIYGQTEGKPLAIRVTGKAEVARSGPRSPNALADLKQGSTIQLSGKSRSWGTKARKVLI
jgi:diacylglycerol kinase family enzyme